MRRLTAAASLATLLFASVAFAQTPQLLVKSPDNPAERPHPISLTKADVHVLMAGQLCETTMTLTFSNDADRVFEGELMFPLPENAAVSGYALDVGGEMVDAVTIERDKARVVFETEARKGIDPGIVEQVQGNNFRTRVYPVPAKGSRTVRVRYVSQLASKDGQLLYLVPLQWPGSTPRLSLRLESISAEAPKVASIPELAFKQEDGRYVAEKQFEKASFHGEIVAALPASAAPSAVVEKRLSWSVSLENFDPKVAEQFAKADFYFVATDLPKPTPVTETATRAKPARIAIAWDASLSRGPVDHAKEFDLIRRHVAGLGTVSVEVIPFRNVPDIGQSFAVANGDSSEIIKYLSSLVYDGGTNLAANRFTRLTALDEVKANGRQPVPVNYYLLFTDGLSNLGADLQNAAEVPVFAVSNDPKSNHALLRRLSSSSGGQYLNLQSLGLDQALASLTEAPFSLLSIDVDPAEVADLYPRLPQPVQGRVTITGRLISKTGKVTLNYGRNGAVTHRVPITLSQDGASESRVVSRFWAQMKLADLSATPDRYEAEITALGKRFDLVTPYTSMIVLETVEQYVQHKIVPPKSRAAVYAEFMKRIEQQGAVARTEERAKIDRVVAMWNARLAWWDQEFKYAADFKYMEPPAKGEPVLALRSDLRAATADAVRAPSPESPRPAATPAERPAGTTAGLPDPGGTIDGARRGLGGVAASGAGRGDTNRFTALRIESEDLREQLGESPLGQRDFFASINVKAWSPDTPYLKALQAAPAAEAYDVYLQQRKSYEGSPAFYLDCADFFAKANPELALRIFTNIPELGIDDGRLLRIAAHRLQQLGQLDLAIDLFEKVARLRPEEPQSFRDLALALADRADAYTASSGSERARSDYERSLQLLYKVVMNQWQRFDEIEVIALTEANRIYARAANSDRQNSFLKNPFDPRLVKLLDPDLRIVMTWDTDNTDIDLHVVEPTGETCIYSHNRTTIGGALSKDFTQGYGPEEYMLRKLMPGEYKIRANFFGNRDQRLVGPTTVQATIITHFGRPDEKRQSMTLRLKDAKDMVDIGTVTLK